MLPLDDAYEQRVKQLNAGELSTSDALNLMESIGRFAVFYGCEINNADLIEELESLYRDLGGPEEEHHSESTLKDVQSIVEKLLQLKKLDTPTQPLQSAAESKTNWDTIHGNTQQTGATSDSGPLKGVVDWRAEVGRAWYAAPTVEAGRVYTTTPSMARVAICLDEGTGEVIWETKQRFTGHQYFTPRMNSDVLIHDDTLFIRETGSRGNVGPAKHLVALDKASGKLMGKTPVGHIDYRVGTAPVTSNETFVVTLDGVQEIGVQEVGSEELPPEKITVFDRIEVRRVSDRSLVWKASIGQTFTYPSIDEANRIVVANEDGHLFCFDAENGAEPIWQRSMPAPVHTQISLAGDCGALVDDAGHLRIISLEDGHDQFVSDPLPVEKQAFQPFSSVAFDGEAAYFSSANCALYKLDYESREVISFDELADWGRAQPFEAHGLIWCTDLSGYLYSFDEALKLHQKERISLFPIFANAAVGESKIFITDGSLNLHAIDPNSLAIHWKHSLIETIEVDNTAYLANFEAGGGDFQSTAIAADERVFVGTPARSVNAYAADSGKQLWRFETRGQVSGAPVHANGRLFFGQQGGNDDFYCVDAASGELIWKKTISWVWCSCTPIDDKLIVPTCDGYIHCLRQSDGETLWSFNVGSGSYPSPAVEDGKVLVGCWHDYYYLLDLENGECLQKHDIEGNPDSGAALLKDGKAYMQGLNARRFICAEAQDGEEVWSVTFPENWECNMSPTFSDERVFFSALSFGSVCAFPYALLLYCCDSRTGEVIWKRYGEGGLTGPSIAESRLLSGSSNNSYFTCRDTETAEVLWRVKLEGRCEETCATIYGSQAFILATDGRLYAFR